MLQALFIQSIIVEKSDLVKEYLNLRKNKLNLRCSVAVKHIMGDDNINQVVISGDKDDATSLYKILNTVFKSYFRYSI